LGFSIAKNRALSLISKNFATQPKKQLSENNIPAYKQFMVLAG